MFIYITYMYNHTYIQICVHAKLTRQPNLRTSPARVSAEYLINLNKYMLKPSPSNQIEGRGMYVYIFVYKHIRSCVYTVPVCIFSIYVCVYMFIYIQIEGRGMYACKCVYTHCIYARTYKYECTHKTQCVAVCCSVLQCVAVCCSVLLCVAVCCSVLHVHTNMSAHTKRTRQPNLSANPARAPSSGYRDNSNIKILQNSPGSQICILLKFSRQPN